MLLNFLLSVFFIFNNAFALNLVEFMTERFAEEPVKTEYQAYQLMKNKHQDLPITYVAVPWVVLINAKQTHLAKHLRATNGWTVCQHDFYEQIIPMLKEIGITTLFTQNVNKSYDGIMVLPFPDIAPNGVDPAAVKDVYCSFVGSEWTHHIRKVMFDSLKKDKRFLLIKRTGTWHFFNKNQGQVAREKKEFQDILARSRFSLCPRGVGANSFRFWESLRAGAIPILISDGLVLPEGVDWNKCIVRVKESEVARIPQILNRISNEREAEMRSNCLEVFRMFSGDNFVSPILRYYQNLKLNQLCI